MAEYTKTVNAISNMYLSRASFAIDGLVIPHTQSKVHAIVLPIHVMVEHHATVCSIQRELAPGFAGMSNKSHKNEYLEVADVQLPMTF
jgi:hypothetical protein